MSLTDLTVRNFRNIAALDLELPESGAVIIGANGQGKTNLLEGIYYLVLFRSFRGAYDRELVRFGTSKGTETETAAARGEPITVQRISSLIWSTKKAILLYA